jgi:hypothetical protein
MWCVCVWGVRWMGGGYVQESRSEQQIEHNREHTHHTHCRQRLREETERKDQSKRGRRTEGVRTTNVQMQ